MAETDVFRARVAAAIARPTWVADGNYSKVRDLVWGACGYRGLAGLPLCRMLLAG